MLYTSSSVKQLLISQELDQLNWQRLDALNTEKAKRRPEFGVQKKGIEDFIVFAQQ